MADGYAIRMDGVQYQAAQDRLLSAVSLAPATALRGRAGVRAGGAPTVTLGSSPESYVVAAHGGVLNDVAGGGTYIYVIPSPVTVPVVARPGTGQSRVDEIVVQVLNSDSRPADGAKEIDIKVITGTASSGTPTPPTVPTGQLRLREANVPSSGSIALSAAPPRTTALGGVLPLADATEEAALSGAGTLYQGLVTFREDLQAVRARFSSSWKRLLTTDDLPYDSGWVDVALASGFSAIAATPQVRCVGTVVYWRGGVTCNGGFTPNANHILAAAAVPEQFRPGRSQNDTFTVLNATSGAAGYRGYVSTTGDLAVTAGPTTAATVYLAGLSGYTVD